MSALLTHRLRYALSTFAALIPLCCLSAAEHTPGLDLALKNSPPDKTIPVILMLDQRIRMEDIYPVASSLPMSERRAFVVNRLKERFHMMGDEVLAFLEQEREENRVSLLRPLWVMNGIRARVTPEVIATIDKDHPEVVYILHDPMHDNTLDQIGWGVAELQAPQCWANPYNANGSGIIVGHVDSGCDWFLPGFAGHIWVNPGEDVNGNGNIDAPDSNGVDDDNNGYIDDLTGWNFDSDSNNNTDNDPLGGGHGTRTASVISCGFSPSNPCDTTSVAPGAKLIVLRGFLYQSSFFEACQYAIEMGASVISASVSFKFVDCDGVRDCPAHVMFRMIAEMELAAGMLHANSTGNTPSGTVPLAIPAPAGCPPPAMTPGHEQQGGVSSVVSVAAYFSNGLFHEGSGRGPFAWSREDVCIHPHMAFCGPPGYASEYPPEYNDYPYNDGASPGLAKPDFSAPTSVPAYARGGGCNSISGTSGATPHVGGVLAVIYSAFPGISPETAYSLLVEAAVDSGDPGWDPRWGFGKLRPFPAIQQGRSERGIVSGVITYSDQTPVGGARISAADSRYTYTNSQGQYSLSLEPGTYNVLVEKYGYLDAVFADIVVTAGGSSQRDAVMQTAPLHALTISVTGQGQPLANMLVDCDEAGIQLLTNDQGRVTFDIHQGSYDIAVGTLPWAVSVLTAHVQGPGQLGAGLVRSVQAQPTGPDMHGYYAYDIYDLPTLQYDWIEISDVGQELTVGDNSSALINLPFAFQYYGNLHTNCRVHANGIIIMGNVSSSEWGPFEIPHPSLPDNYISPFFNDWLPNEDGGVYYYDDSENGRVIFEWYEVPDYYDFGPATFQCILYDPLIYPTPTGDGMIKFQYHTLAAQYEGTVGIESPAGTDGIQYQFQLYNPESAVPVADGLALLFTTELIDDADSRNEVAQEFALFPNYPNPFNASTTFSFSLPREVTLRLALYDVLGRLADVVADGEFAAGRHTVSFDASALASGLYFARLETESRAVAIQKVMLLK